MAGRSRSYGDSYGWDDYNNYDQYDDDNSASPPINPRRLYVTNIPHMLNGEGLRAAFSQFGTLEEVFISKDPTKKYGMVTFETPGEAKLALMKMNRTEPLKLIVRHAQAGRKGQSKEFTVSTRDKNSKSDLKKEISRIWNDRLSDDMTNGNDTEDMEKDMVFEERIDPELHLELESLRLQQLKVQAEQLQCQHRMLLLKQAEKKNSSHQPSSSIQCILPDGRIVTRNSRPESRDADMSFGAGAGDSLTIPGLQPSPSRACVRCAAPAEAYCARCGVAPYCSLRCQQRDWHDRHKAVCHNLARLSGGNTSVEPENAPVVQPAAPLRRPHSPASVKSGSARFNRQQSSSRSGMGRGGYAGRQPSRKVDKSSSGSDTSEKRRTPSVSQDPPKQQLKVELPAKKELEAPKEVPIPKPVANSNGFNAAIQTPNVAGKVPQEVLDMYAPQGVKASFEEPTTPVTVASDSIVPKIFMVSSLPLGETVVLSVEATAQESKTTKGFVCVTMHSDFEYVYQKLCDQFTFECQKDDTPFIPSPGDTFAYLNLSDGGWYRARCLNKNTAALIDAAKVVPVTPANECRQLPFEYAHVPEFSCLLDVGTAHVGDNLKCTLLSKNKDAFSVSVENIETGVNVGTGVLSRWVPKVDYPKQMPLISEIERPDLVNNSSVLAVVINDDGHVVIRKADNTSMKIYDTILNDCVYYAKSATPLTECPQKGQLVLAMYENQYCRALVKRTNVKSNKYLLEFVEFGTTIVKCKEDLLPCPDCLHVTSSPAVTSTVELTQLAATPAGRDYIRQLNHTHTVLTLTLPPGLKKAPNGSPVTLTVAKNNENVNRKLEMLCTPDWKKLENNGEDVVQLESLMHSDLKYRPLPSEGCTLEVLDISCLAAGSLSACIKDDPHALYVHTTLTEKMAEYCNSELGKQPYLPKPEELCIAQCPPYPQWFRAIVLDQPTGPGGPAVRVCYMDYGNVETVPVSLLRKMLPEFVKGLPAVASLVDIKGFPKDPSPEILTRAIELMKINDEGRGVLHVTKCELQDEEGMYSCEAPALLSAIHCK